MILKDIRLKNYRCFGEQIHWKPSSQLNILVGENNSGKSSIFKFLKQIHKIQQFHNGNFGKDEWHKQDTSENVEFEILYEINECFLSKLNHFKDEIKISSFNELNEIFHSGTSKYLNIAENSNVTRILDISEEIIEYLLEIKGKKEKVEEIQGYILSKLNEYHGLDFTEDIFKESLIAQSVILNERESNIPFVQLLSGLVFYSYNEILSKDLNLRASIKFGAHTNSSMIIDNYNHIDHFRELISDQSGIYNENQHYRELIRIWMVEVEQSIINHLESSLIYIEEIRMRSSSSKAQVYTCPDGRHLADVLHTLLMNESLEFQEKYKEIKKQFQDFYPNHNFNIVENSKQELIIQVVDEIQKIPLKLEEYGTGMMDILIIITNLIAVEGKIIVIEEPETHIHPIFQRKLMNVIEKSSEKNQIFVTTHSPDFFSFEHIESIVRIAQHNKISQIHSFDINSLKKLKNKRLITNPCTFSTIRSRYTKILTPQVKNAFFAKGVILVEGETENLSLPIWAKLLDYNLETHSIEIVNCFSKFNIIDIAEILRMYQIPLFIIFDEDNPIQDKNHRTQNKWLKDFLEINESTEFLENAVIGENFFIFKPKYEKAIIASEPKYHEIEEKIVRENKFQNNPKGLKAYFAALEYEKLKKKPPKLISDLINAIKLFFV